MADSMSDRLDAVERKPVKCKLRGTSETFVRGGQIFEQARECAQFSKEQAAGFYGVSASLLSRQMSNQDNQHLSFQRMCEMPVEFQREVILAWAERLDGVEVERQIRIRRA